MTEYSVILNSIKTKNGQSCASLPQEAVKLTEVIPKVKYSKEKEIKEEYIKTKNDLIFEILIESESWIETVAMNSKNKLTVIQVKENLKKYNITMNTQFDLKNNKNEYCSHFTRWLDKQDVEIKSNALILNKRKEF